MAVTRCTLATVRGRLIAAVNAAPAATWATTISSSNDNRRNDTEIDNIILAEDAKICTARAKRVGDGYRSLFLSLSGSIAHAGIIPDCLGPPEQILIQRIPAASYDAGIFDSALSLADIERWRANVGTKYGANHSAANSVISGFYIRRGKQLFYTGNDAKAQLANFTRSGACQAPETDEAMLFGLSLGSAIKEGDTAPFLATIIADARAEYAELLKSEPDPTITTTLAVGV